MKKTLLLCLILFITSCGNDPAPNPPQPPTPIPTPTPPTPPPVPTTFEVTGQKILVKAEMKPQAKVSLLEMKAAIVSAVAQLEPKPLGEK